MTASVDGYREWVESGCRVETLSVPLPPAAEGGRRADRLAGALDVVERMVEDAEHIAATLEEEGVSARWMDAARGNLLRTAENLRRSLPASLQRRKNSRPA